MESVKTAALQPVGDRPPADPNFDQLFAPDDPVLAARKLGHSPLDLTRAN